MYEKLTVFLPKLEDKPAEESFAPYGTQISVSSMYYDQIVGMFDDAIMQFVSDHEEMGLRQYYDIMESAGIMPNRDPMRHKGISSLDGRTTVALIVWAMRADRFSPGSLMQFCKDGSIVRCLRRLKQIDSER